MIEAAVVAFSGVAAILTIGILAGRILRARSKDLPQTPEVRRRGRVRIVNDDIDWLAEFDEPFTPQQSARVKAAVLAETSCGCSCACCVRRHGQERVES